MIESNLFEDCEAFIERDLENWKSYFSKWEVIAKYEESIPESELLKKPFGTIKSVKEKKMKRPSCKKKPKRVHPVILQKNLRHQKKHVKKMQDFANSNTKNKIIKKYGNFKSDYIVSDPVNEQMEMILKSVFTHSLKTNLNNLETFGVLYHMYLKRERIDPIQLISRCQQVLSCNELHSNERNCLIMNQYISPLALPSVNISNISVCPAGDIQRSFKLNFFDFYAQPIIDNEKLNRTEFIPTGNFSKLDFSFKNNKNLLQPLMSVPNNTTPPQTIQTNVDIKSCHSTLLDGPLYENAKLKLFELDFSQTPQTNLFRKINKEYINKKVFPEINIIQNEKRFKNLWLRERTNNVSLNMENSNFATQERKPSERKCFSENVLQRKRGHPSKLFFDNEEEDSESDDQTQNHAPFIYSKNKIKSQVVSKIMDDESDSDDCESIFDRIKKC